MSGNFAEIKAASRACVQATASRWLKTDEFGNQYTAADTTKFCAIYLPYQQLDSGARRSMHGGSGSLRHDRKIFL
jgi:hypothetical protein